MCTFEYYSSSADSYMIIGYRSSFMRVQKMQHCFNVHIIFKFSDLKICNTDTLKLIMSADVRNFLVFMSFLPFLLICIILFSLPSKILHFFYIF